MDSALGLNINPLEGVDLFKPIPKTAEPQGIDGSKPQMRDPEREKVAKAFESILLVRLMEQMKNSVGKWGLEEDPTSEQVQGIFWMHLAEEMGAQGGIGLWKNIYEYMNDTMPNTPSKGLDLRL
ncbi:MAG: hypothetical protein IIA65_00605 [Planctomycetes bacterium]|nr:hypothetical protein [Planctomycetota bacterium]